MQVKSLKLGRLKTNCYIVTDNHKSLIIDPADEPEKIIAECQNTEVVAILVTHHHWDHVLALRELEEYYNLKHNAHTSSSIPYEVIKTPGHASDSLTFYFPKAQIMFTGDFLFYHTIGRCDLETSSVPAMINSLELIKKYPDDIIIYPGHGKPSILGEEKPLFSSYF
ncbi:MAG: MBL fold metallo-hydrolase [Bacilli bacterium]|nr:MBL fold metallo-hydrolase [Bacilli bacterium]